MWAWKPGLNQLGDIYGPFSPHPQVASTWLDCFLSHVLLLMNVLSDGSGARSGKISTSQLEFVKLLSERGNREESQKYVIRADLFLVSCMLKALAPANTHALGNIKENICLVFNRHVSLIKVCMFFSFCSLIYIIRFSTFTFMLGSLAKGSSLSTKQWLTNVSFTRCLSCCNFHNSFS